MVQRSRPGQSAVHQQRESHVHGGGRAIRHRRHRLHHPRRLSGLQRGWMPRPVSAQQFTQGFCARGSDPPPRGSQEHEPQRLQSALSEQLRRNVHERVRASWHPATGRLWTRRGRRRLQRGWATRHLRFERRRAQRCPLHQQRRWHVHRQGRAMAQAHQPRGDGGRRRRLQQRRLARHCSGGHDAAEPGPTQTDERVPHLRQSRGAACQGIPR